jgi:Fe-S-cluster containining protein
MNINSKSNGKIEKLDFTYPVNIKFECNRCSLCCGDTKQKTRHILLLETEAKKIAAHTSCSISDFSREINDKFPYIYEMKKTNEGKCVQLKDNQCCIYPLRPLICMFYPFELKFDEKKGMHNFDFTVECPGINQGKVFLEKDFRKLFKLAQESLG